MLKYFKYIAVISFIVVLVAAFFAGVFFRSFAADSVIRVPNQEISVIAADNFKKNILCKYHPVFASLANQPVKTWPENKYFNGFNRVTSIALGNIPFSRISLYNDKKERFFTTVNSDVVSFGSRNDDILSQLSASVPSVSVIIPSLGLYDSYGQLIKGSYVRSAIRIKLDDCPNAQGNKPVTIIMETYRNVTTPWDSLYFFQAVISAGIVTTFILLYLALFITSRKTEKLINKQHEEKLNLEKAKTAAEADNQQKSMFLANVSHELRTPLNAIIGFSDIIKDEVMGPVGHPQYKEYISDINSSGVHLLSLINDILDYSKAEARKLDVEVVDIDLSKIAHSCMRLVEPRANEAKVKLVESLPSHHVILSADPKRIKQIILNLLSNAVKFTPEGGEVSIIIKEDMLEGKVSLIVADSGIGIAAKDISRAMAPFGQIDSSISRRFEGTGLGLPLSKKLTELMGGTFEIKSEVGLGTTITLIFPILQSGKNTDKF